MSSSLGVSKTKFIFMCIWELGSILQIIHVNSAVDKTGH